MNRRVVLAAALAGVGGVVTLAWHALAQPPVPSPPPATVVTRGADGNILEQTPDGKILRTFARDPNATGGFVPMTTSDGRNIYAYRNVQVQDAETLKLLGQEQAAAQEARTLAAQYSQADSDPTRADAKKKLRDKLAAIFDLQQQRRAREVAQIEERLAKLKDTMKKRDASKDPIVDRRLEQLTGGVDELGWEETGAGAGGGAPFGYGYPELPGRSPDTVPVPARYAPPGALPGPATSPVPVAPGR